VQDEEKTKEQLIAELDETRRRADRAEKALRRRAEELEQHQEEFKTFVYIISHDLRTPLINLKGFAAELRLALENIQSALGPVLSDMDEPHRSAVTTALQEEVPEALGFIEHSVTRIDSFMGAILKLSRLSRRALKLETIDMTVLVQDVLKSLAPQIEQRRVRVTVGPLPDVIADRASMEEVLSNILTNAVNYLDPSRPGEIEITGECEPEGVAFRVRDNGRGIAADDLHKVFEPFRRAGRQDVPGDGMGMAYAQALVRRHGGSIACTSEPGVGTTFTFAISSHLAQGDEHAQ
jgi:signal transduction histidine kinase